MSANETGGSFLLGDYVDDVFAIEITCVSQEGLFAKIVVAFAKRELGVVVTKRVQWEGLLERPTSNALEAFFMSSSV